MRELISNLGIQLREALEIGRKTEFTRSTRPIKNIVICGMGGSGIGGTIVSELVQHELNVPVVVVKNYNMPSFVNQHTLVLANSYSGNTEETLNLIQQAREVDSQICVITSGGNAREMAQRNNWNHYVIPAGNPPRSMLAYSITLQLFVLKRYELLDIDFEASIERFVDYWSENESTIQNEAEEVANQLVGKTPVIYSTAPNEGIAVRLRQQLNENSKMLCWHAVIPEMNHNELVGWTSGNEDIAVLLLRNHSDFERNQMRIEINKEIIQPFSPNIYEIWSPESTRVEETLFHIHFGDWISYFLSERNGVDIMAIEAIDHLKSELEKM